MSSLSFDATAQYFYERRYQLDIIPFGKTAGVTYGNDSTTGARLRVQFEVERSFNGGADKAKISIYNLSPRNRSAIARGTTMRLRAGYRGRMGLLFTGTVRNVSSDQQGPDVVTVAQLGDGEPVISYGTVNRSYTSPVTLAQVLQDVARDLELDLGGHVVDVAPGVVKGLPDVTYPLGLTVTGAVRDWLEMLLKDNGLDWSIQNGKLNILPRGGTQYVTATVVSKRTGMVGTPAFNEKYLKFTSLMNHQLVPGAYVQIVSDNRRVSGYYRLATAKVTGDTHEAPWTVECEGELLKEPLPLLPAAQGADFSKAVTP